MINVALMVGVPTLAFLLGMSAGTRRYRARLTRALHGEGNDNG